MVRERTQRVNGDAAPSAQSVPAPNGLNVAELRQLISLMNGSDLDEITIEHQDSGLHLTLRKPEPLAAGTATQAGGLAGPGDFAPDGMEAAAPSADDTGQPHPVAVSAPLVGVFRAAIKGKGSKGGPPLMVQVGDLVREGQVVGAIESLNVLNEVEARAAGRVVEILVSDGQPVEYGQTLLLIEHGGAQD